MTPYDPNAPMRNNGPSPAAAFACMGLFLMFGGCCATLGVVSWAAYHEGSLNRALLHRVQLNEQLARECADYPTEWWKRWCMQEGIRRQKARGEE